MPFLTTVSRQTEEAVLKQPGDFTRSFSTFFHRGKSKRNGKLNSPEEVCNGELNSPEEMYTSSNLDDFPSRETRKTSLLYGLDDPSRQTLAARLERQKKLEKEAESMLDVFNELRFAFPDVATIHVQKTLLQRSRSEHGVTTQKLRSGPQRTLYLRVKGPFGIPWMVLDHRSDWTVRWMIVIFLFTVYTAVLTPIEVSFMTTKLNGWFYINRVVDFFFLLDLIVNFFLTYQHTEDRRLETRPGEIALHYLKFWFWLDVISLIPYDLIAFLLEDGDSSNFLSNVKMLRIIRLFRLIKLVRILRAGRMFQSYQMEYAINYNQLSLVKFLVTIVFLIHMMTCGLCFLPTIQGEDGWLDENGLVGASSHNIYIVAMYWASMTVSTIGYGDIALTTQYERIYASVCMMIGATAYAFIVGQLCGLIVNLDKEGSQFTSELSDLNTYMSKHHISQDIQKKVRHFYGYSKEARALKGKEHLLKNLSPALYTMVLLHTNEAWVKNIPFFKTNDIDVLSEISNCLRSRSFAPNEVIVREHDFQTKLFMVTKGVCFYRGRIITKGGYFGEGVVLVKVPTYGAPAITNKYVDTSYIERNDLLKIMSRFPEIRYQTKKLAIKLRLKDIGTSSLIKDMALKYKAPGAVDEQVLLRDKHRPPCKTIQDLENLILEIEENLYSRISNVTALLEEGKRKRLTSY